MTKTDDPAAGRVPSSRSRRGPSSRTKLALLLLAPVISIEVAFRAHAWHRNNITLEAAFRLPDERPAGASARLIDIIQPSPNDRLIYELRPNLVDTYKEKAFTTSRDGFRSPDVPHEPAEGTLTIVGIGASIMFGQGVADDELYARLLEADLNELYPQRVWRFINTAVPSYNVVMKVETLVEKGLAFQPDLVLLNIASNNLSLPAYIRVEEDPTELGRSFILDFLRDLRARRDTTRRYEARLAHVKNRELSWRAMIQTDPASIPAEYRELVGWEPFHRAMDRLAELSVEHDFEVIVFANLEVDLTIGMLEAARERGFHVLTIHEQLREHLEASGRGINIDAYRTSALCVSPTDAHPSSLQHRMIADALLAKLEQVGTVERRLGPR